MTTEHARFWTDEQIAQLQRLYPDTTAEHVAKVIGRHVRSIYRKANELGLKKSEAFNASDMSRRIARGKQSDAMRVHQFVRGQEAWNKGIKGSTGTHANCKAHQFRPGRKPEEARNYRPVGSLRITKDGYLERKVSDDQSIAPARRWVAEHRLVWEAANGQTPPGHIVVFREGAKTVEPELVTLDRLECISRAENMRRNTYHQYGPEVAALIQLRGAINRQINKRTKEQA